MVYFLINLFESPTFTHQQSVTWLKTLLVLIGCMASPLEAKDFGVQGKTYPVIELSLLEHIRTQLSGLSQDTLVAKQLEIQARIKAGIESPPPVKLPKLQQRRVRLFDPSITLTQDIVDGKGRLIAAKGTPYHPFSQVTLRSALLMFDGTDPKELAWARSQGPDTKWILIKGQPLKLMEQEGRDVYFDQGGAITQRFKIQGTPVRMFQKGRHVVIEEGLEAPTHE